MKEYNSLHPQPALSEQSRATVVLTEKEVLSLYKKSRSSDVPFDIIETVFIRGYEELYEATDSQRKDAGFSRVNSFIAGGLASDLDEDLKKSCWKGYEAIGVKKKNGKTVPNCVPVKEDAEKHSKDFTNPASRFDGSDELVAIYKKQTPGQIVKRVVKEGLESKYKSPSGGMTRAGVKAYRRKNPGSKLQTAVTTEPSKLDPDSKAAKRRKSFCSRMGGMKKKLTSSKTANDPDSRINKALRKWNCRESMEENNNE